jgi:hypothetical protein
VVKRYFTILAMALVIGAPASAQQKPAAAAEKAAAEQKAADEKAGRDSFSRMAAEQAEAVARAQQKVAEEARRAEEERVRLLEAKLNELIPLDIEVVVSRYQGDKKISSLPYFLAVNAGQRPEATKLRMGANVPVPSTAFSTADGKPAIPLVSYNYQNVGTDIDCSARPLGDGRFVVNVGVKERSVVQPPATCNGAASCAPVIRNFEAENNLVLRDGQTRQFTAAADRVTGEVVKVDVTLKMAK